MVDVEVTLGLIVVLSVGLGMFLGVVVCKVAEFLEDCLD